MGINSGGLTKAAGVTYLDDSLLELGAAQDAQFQWYTDDANANSLLLTLPNGDGTNVPVFVLGDRGGTDPATVDLGLFNGFVDPTIAILDQTNADYLRIYHDGTDGRIDVSSGVLRVVDSLFITSTGELQLGDGRDWRINSQDINGNATLVIDETTVEYLFFSGALMTQSDLNAAANVAGNAVFIHTEMAGTVTAGAGLAGGSYTLRVGDGSAAFGGSGAVGGAGADVVLIPGAGGAGDGAGAAGATGDVVVRQPGGVIGTDELLLSHNGTDALLGTSSGALTLNAAQKVKRTAVASVAGGASPDVYTVLATDFLIAVDTTNDSVTVDLQAAATAGAGRMLIVKDEGLNASVNNVTIDPNAAELIDGDANLPITADGASVTIYCNGTSWFVI